jgi:hypothetical protein
MAGFEVTIEDMTCRYHILPISDINRERAPNTILKLRLEYDAKYAPWNSL